MPKYQGESESAPQDEGGDPAVEAGKEAAAASDGFQCKHCGGPTDEDGQSVGQEVGKVPPYQLSKFSPQDRGYGAIGVAATKRIGNTIAEVAKSSPKDDAARSEAAAK